MDQIEYTIREIERTEKFAKDREYILEYCRRIAGEKARKEGKDDRQIQHVGK